MEEKVIFPTFTLLDEATEWWEIDIKKLGPNDAPFTWEGFKMIFYERYFF